MFRGNAEQIEYFLPRRQGGVSTSTSATPEYTRYKRRLTHTRKLLKYHFW